MADERRADVLVIGAGPAGIAAAEAAARSDRSVILLDDNPEVGGQIWRGEARKPSSPEIKARLDALASSGAIRVTGTQVVGFEPPGEVLAEREGTPVRFSARTIVLATGARERFLPFPGWTLPNVMGAGGLQAMVKSGLPIRGKRVVVAGSGPLLLAVAAYLAEKGGKVLPIVEQADFSRVARFGLGLWRSPSKLGQALDLRRKLGGIPTRFGAYPVRAEGSGRLERVTIRRGGRDERIDCDYLACGFGLVPNVECALMIGCLVADGRVATDEFGRTSVPNVLCAGEARGIGGLDSALIEGEIAGLVAAGKDPSRLLAKRHEARRFADALERAFELRSELKSLAEPETIVCRCEDVSMGDLMLRDNALAGKLQTRCGMGPCQGRICGPIQEFCLGWTRGSVRPPLFPTTLATLAELGRPFDDSTPE